MTIDPDAVASRMSLVRARAAVLGAPDVAVVAVTKSFGPEAIAAAHATGCDGMGENYAQELLAKVPSIPAELPVHFIGRLQSNKVKSLSGIVSVWESVDRPGLVDEIAKRAGRGARVLLQVDTTGEASKGGCAPDQLDGLLERAARAGLSVEGLMTVGPTGGTRSECAAAFGLLRRLADLRGLRECSMGMSDDWEIALAEGATIVRLGSALFGERPR